MNVLSTILFLFLILSYGCGKDAAQSESKSDDSTKVHYEMYEVDINSIPANERHKYQPHNLIFAQTDGAPMDCQNVLKLNKAEAEPLICERDKTGGASCRAMRKGERSYYNKVLLITMTNPISKTDWWVAFETTKVMKGTRRKTDSGKRNCFVSNSGTKGNENTVSAMALAETIAARERVVVPREKRRVFREGAPPHELLQTEYPKGAACSDLIRLHQGQTPGFASTQVQYCNRVGEDADCYDWKKYKFKYKRVRRGASQKVYPPIYMITLPYSVTGSPYWVVLERDGTVQKKVIDPKTGKQKTKRITVGRGQSKIVGQYKTVNRCHARYSATQSTGLNKNTIASLQAGRQEVAAQKEAIQQAFMIGSFVPGLNVVLPLVSCIDRSLSGASEHAGAQHDNCFDEVMSAGINAGSMFVFGAGEWAKAAIKPLTYALGGAGTVRMGQAAYALAQGDYAKAAHYGIEGLVAFAPGIVRIFKARKAAEAADDIANTADDLAEAKKLASKLDDCFALTDACGNMVAVKDGAEREVKSISQQIDNIFDSSKTTSLRVEHIARPNEFGNTGTLTLSMKANGGPSEKGIYTFIIRQMDNRKGISVVMKKNGNLVATTDILDEQAGKILRETIKKAANKLTNNNNLNPAVDKLYAPVPDNFGEALYALREASSRLKGNLARQSLSNSASTGVANSTDDLARGGSTVSQFADETADFNQIRPPRDKDMYDGVNQLIDDLESASSNGKGLGNFDDIATQGKKNANVSVQRKFEPLSSGRKSYTVGLEIPPGANSQWFKTISERVLNSSVTAAKKAVASGKVNRVVIDSGVVRNPDVAKAFERAGFKILTQNGKRLEHFDDPRIFRICFGDCSGIRPIPTRTWGAFSEAVQ